MALGEINLAVDVDIDVFRAARGLASPSLGAADRPGGGDGRAGLQGDQGQSPAGHHLEERGE